MFEYTAMVWSNRDVAGLLAHLNGLGAEGWEMTGFAPMGWSSPMSGMGADVSTELIVLLKRQR
jgi:hypothetical protein